MTVDLRRMTGVRTVWQEKCQYWGTKDDLPCDTSLLSQVCIRIILTHSLTHSLWYQTRAHLFQDKSCVGVHNAPEVGRILWLYFSWMCLGLGGAAERCKPYAHLHHLNSVYIPAIHKYTCGSSYNLHTSKWKFIHAHNTGQHLNIGSSLQVDWSGPHRRELSVFQLGKGSQICSITIYQDKSWITINSMTKQLYNFPRAWALLIYEYDLTVKIDIASDVHACLHHHQARITNSHMFLRNLL